MKRGEKDQRESEATNPDSEDSGFEDSSNAESIHESDEEPPAPKFPPKINKKLFDCGERGLPVPLGVYVQFDSLVLPENQDVMDQYQPAVYGFLRPHRAAAGNGYDGYEVDVSGTGRQGR